jgi:hypothetical protein
MAMIHEKHAKQVRILIYSPSSFFANFANFKNSVIVILNEVKNLRHNRGATFLSMTKTIITYNYTHAPQF